MPSILPNYEYDIFISYRQNDNKRDGWVSNFVEALKDELEATLKNPVSIYFDENPHDGLLETHQVGASLEKKLKCLVFIPIVSQTYCDTKSFAWEHEFLPFVKMAREDELGMNITLANGNVASRVLPVKIHDLDIEDQSILEKELDGPLRSIDFIYKEPGVNRPLSPDDKKEENLNAASYKNQINKVANALKEMGSSVLRNAKIEAGDSTKSEIENVDPIAVSQSKRKISLKMILGAVLIPLVLILAYYLFTNIGAKNTPVEALEKTIAVLPFANTKPDPDTDYLGFAMANQVIGGLGYNKSLTVRPSSAIRKYDQQVVDAYTVADDLKVNYVLTGNYLIEANIIRLDIELVDATNNIGIWRDKLEVDFNNAFELQDMVAEKVVEGLDVQFSPKELDIIKSDVSANPLAYEYYLRSLSYPRTTEGNTLAIEMLKNSITLDSSYAPAYVEVGNRINDLLVYGSKSERQEQNAINYYLKALSLNENLVAALTGLGARYAETGRTTEAVTYIRKALSLNPNDANAHFFLGYLYRYTGILDESIKEMEIALTLDPGNPRFRSLGVTYFNAGENEKAFQAFALDKGTVWEMGWQSIIHYYNQEYDKTIELSTKIIEAGSGGTWIYNSQIFLAVIQGNPEEGVLWVKKFEQANLDSEGNVIDAESSFYNAAFYSQLGEKDGALRSLKKAINNGYFNYPFMKDNHLFDSLREDKEYQAILAMAKEKHEAFKKEFFNKD
ncbi:MAG: hypothetical protein ABFS32_13035 [Bacteroidota bacterium]